MLKFVTLFLMLTLGSDDASDCRQKTYNVIRKAGPSLSVDEIISRHNVTSSIVMIGCHTHCERETRCVGFNYRETKNLTNCELTNVTNNSNNLKTGDWILWRNPETKPLDSTSSSSQTRQQSTTTPSTCSFANWWQTFDKMGWSKCEKEYLFITGFYRSSPSSDSDPIGLLEEARCCNSTATYSGQNGQCKIANWRDSLDKNGVWNNCSEGYLLNALLRSTDNNLHNIEEGRCCKPSSHPDKYGSCYDEDVGTSFNQKGWSNCSQAEYYIAGLYRGNGNWLNNIDKFRCCRMVAI